MRAFMLLVLGGVARLRLVGFDGTREEFITSDTARGIQNDGHDRVAAGWKKWTRVSSRREAGPYFDAAVVTPGDRVLEIGAGTGDQTIPLAQKVGRQGRVVAVDPSQEMLAFAEQRTRRAALDNIEFCVGDLAHASPTESSFDAAISGFTWLFLPDPVGEASRVLGLLKPGGRFAASVWGRVPDVPIIALPLRVVLDTLEMDTAKRLANAPSPLSNPDDFAGVFTQAGFVDVRVDEYRVNFRFDSAQEFADWVFDINMPIVDLVERRAPERRDEFKELIASAAAPQAATDGSITFSNPALMAAGARPVG